MEGDFVAGEFHEWGVGVLAWECVEARKNLRPHVRRIVRPNFEAMGSVYRLLISFLC